MNPIQESKQELEASIRYAENAIASAKQTIESIAKSQEQTGREQALENLLDDHRASAFEDAKTIGQLKSQVALLEERIRNDVPTMPVIPKAVAIAIFREGIQTGVDAACSELDGQRIMVEESDYVGNFEVSFTKEIDLEDELDLDWMRGKCGDYTEDAVIDALKGLCADKEFDCRIHGVDDQEEKKND